MSFYDDLQIGEIIEVRGVFGLECQEFYRPSTRKGEGMPYCVGNEDPTECVFNVFEIVELVNKVLVGQNISLALIALLDVEGLLLEKETKEYVSPTRENEKGMNWRAVRSMQYEVVKRRTT